MSWVAVAMATLAVSAVGSAQDRSPHSRAEWVVDAASWKVGSPMRVGLRIEPEPGWYFYWLNPGDAGMPVDVSWTLPPGWSAGSLEYPTPERFASGGALAFGYREAAVIWTTLTPSSTGPADLTADVSWMVCRDACIPARETLRLRLPLSTPGAAQALREAPSTMPKPWKGTAQGAWETSRAEARLTSPDWPEATGWDFFPADPESIDPARPILSTTRKGNSLTLSLRRSEFATSAPERLRGILLPLGTEGRRLNAGWWIDVPFGPTTSD